MKYILELCSGFKLKNCKGRQQSACFLDLYPPSGRSQERAVKHLLELWDSARLQDAGASSLYLLSLCPFRDGTKSEEQSQASVTKQSIQRSPSASDMMAALAERVQSLNPTCSCSVAGSEQALHS